MTAAQQYGQRKRSLPNVRDRERQTRTRRESNPLARDDVYRLTD